MPQYRPQYFVILIIGIPKKGSLVLVNRHTSGSYKPWFLQSPQSWASIRGQTIGPWYVPLSWQPCKPMTYHLRIQTHTSNPSPTRKKQVRWNLWPSNQNVGSLCLCGRWGPYHLFSKVFRRAARSARRAGACILMEAPMNSCNEVGYGRNRSGQKGWMLHIIILFGWREGRHKLRSRFPHAVGSLCPRNSGWFEAASAWGRG